MKQLYLSCEMGAAGDMLLGALSELTDTPEKLPERLMALGLPGVTAERTPVISCGISGMRLTVKICGVTEEAHHEQNHGHHYHGHSMEDIDRLIMNLPVSERVKTDAKNIYCMLAYAEAKAHGCPVAEIHFHEVGMLDAVVDIVGCAMLMEELQPDFVTVSTVSLGGGTVHCAHGILPVPAPATALLLNGMPVRGGPVEAELCTPTGAAILHYFANGFGPMPPMRLKRTGCGYGMRAFDRPNCVRAFLGEDQENRGPDGQVAELCCNVDDMTGEEAGDALDGFMQAGALDAFITPIQMKKGRPGMLFTLLCGQAEQEQFAQLMLQNTTTFGVRVKPASRYTLGREEYPVPTEYGPIRIKRGTGYGITKTKAAFEDLAAASKARGVSTRTVGMAALNAYKKSEKKD